jgi:eukaryotic-like serine/threonine-protein kinase
MSGVKSMNSLHGNTTQTSHTIPESRRTSPAESLIGHTIAGVRIEKLIGQGGMAEVYLGQHIALNKPVALKILLAHLREDPMLMHMLQTEATALTSMEHPNIVQCIDCNVYQGRPYIIMELINGITLKDRLSYLGKQGLIPALHIVKRVVQSTSAALDYAHARGIVHRDLKPANMMLIDPARILDPTSPLTQDTKVVLTDFGVARLMEATEVRGMVVGTPAYMSPEQSSGKPVDLRADIYSLGVVIYQMLVGEVPSHPALVQTAPGERGESAGLKSSPPAMPNTPKPVRAVVSRALTHQAEARYANAGELALAFERAVRESIFI